MSITVPLSFHVASATPTSLTFSWDPPSSGNAAYYKVYCIYGGSGIPAPQGTQTADTTLTVTGLASLLTYRCFVWAFEADGTASTAAYVAGTPSGVTAPNDFRSLSEGVNTINVAWTGGGEGITSYKVEWTGGYNSGNLGAEVSSYQLTGLNPNTVYSITLKAYGTNSMATTSISASTTLDPYNLPAPTGLYQINSTSTSVTFGWNPVQLATSYDIFSCTEANGFYQHAGNVPGTQGTVSGLVSNKLYYLKVLARNNYGVSPLSGPQPGTNYPLAIQTLAMTATSGFVVNNTTDSTADFSWNTNPEANHYKLIVTTSGSYIETRYTSASLYGNSATAIGLLPSYPHIATLWAYPTLANEGGSATEISFNTQAMPAPSEGEFVSGTETSITVAWENMAATYNISGYSLTISGPGITTSTAFTQANSHTFTLASNGLQPNEFYDVFVKAMSATVGGDSAYSEAIPTYSGIVPVPSIPENLRQTARTDTTISLAWNEADAASFYQIFKNGIFELETETLTATLADLQQETTYSIQVKAFNFQNSSALSLPVTMSTQGPPSVVLLDIPDQLEVDVGIPTTLTWIPCPAVEDVTSYDIQIATNTSFTNLLIDSNLIGSNVGSFLTSILLESNQYYWRVRANNSSGNGQWSEVRTFYTIELPPSAPIRQSPNGGEVVGLGIAFTWSEGERASEYRLIIARDAQFQIVVREIVGISSNSTSRYVILQDINQAFYWKIGAINGGGEAWSDTGIFYTENIAISLPAPTGLVMSDFIPTIFSYSVKLAWAALEGATSYTVHFNDGVENYSISAPAVGGEDAPSAVLSTYRPGKDITAWVVAHNSTGKSTPSVSAQASIASEKSTDGLIEIVKHVGTTVTIKLKNLSSQNVTSNDIYYNTGGADTYLKSIIEPGNMDNPDYEDTLVNLLVDENRHYTIKRISKFSNGDPYATSSITTLTPTEAPVITGADTINNGIMLTWNTVSGATKYYVYIDGRYRMTSTTANTIIDNLLNEHPYSIVVGGYSQAGVYNTSQPMLVTPTDLPSAPEEFNGYYDVNHNFIMLDWSIVDNASGYQIYYKTNDSLPWNGTGLFYNGLAADSSINIGSKTILTAQFSNLAPNTVYYFGIASKGSLAQAGEIKTLNYNITTPGEFASASMNSAPSKVGLKIENNEITISWTPAE